MPYDIYQHFTFLISLVDKRVYATEKPSSNHTLCSQQKIPKHGTSNRKLQEKRLGIIPDIINELN